MITQDRLKELLLYNKETGLFTWRSQRSNRVKKGSVAGSTGTRGYIRIGIDGIPYLAHRLAFLYVEGKIPDTVDHINIDKSDNKWNNLRACSPTENQRNRPVSVDSSTGVKGVTCEYGGKYRARIRVDGVRYNLGSYDSLDEAAELVQLVREEAHGEFARH